MTSKRTLEDEISDLRWMLDKGAVEAERLREEAADLAARLYNAGKALEVLAPMLYKRYSPKGVLRWDDLIADAKRVEEYNATTEVLHFIEVSQEGLPF